MNIFILDDDEERIKVFETMLKGHRLTIARSCDNAAKFQPHEDTYYDVVFLDHDLGTELTGNDFVRLITPRIDAETKDFTAFVVHSWNVPAGKRMVEQLTALGCYAEYCSFGGPEWLNWINQINKET